MRVSPPDGAAEGSTPCSAPPLAPAAPPPRPAGGDGPERRLRRRTKGPESSPDEVAAAADVARDSAPDAGAVEPARRLRRRTKGPETLPPPLEPTPAHFDLEAALTEVLELEEATSVCPPGEPSRPPRSAPAPPYGAPGGLRACRPGLGGLYRTFGAGWQLLAHRSQRLCSAEPLLYCRTCGNHAGSRQKAAGRKAGRLGLPEERTARHDRLQSLHLRTGGNPPPSKKLCVSPAREGGHETQSCMNL